MKKVLAIIDSFKGTLDSVTLGKIIKDVADEDQVQLDFLPISDGGEGFHDAISYVIDAKEIKVAITDLDGRNRASEYLVYQDVAYIEVAKLIGFTGFKSKLRLPYDFTSKALGEVVLDLYNKGIREVVIGLGGSLTNDFGVGLIEVLGAKFYDRNNNLMKNVTPKLMMHISRVDLSNLEKYKDLKITVTSDVTNPLLGETGATHVFARQKGASRFIREKLEEAGTYYSKLLIEAGAKDYINLPGAGAAGGLGFALASMFDTKIVSGIDYVLNLMKFDKIVEHYDVIVTGEGKIDQQSLSGKVVFNIANKTDKDVYLVSALSLISTKEAKAKFSNIKKIYSIVPSLASREESLANASYYFKKLAEKVIFDIKNN